MLKRKKLRLKEYDHNTPGAYFITICTKERKKILGNIVGTGLPDGPKKELSNYGRIAEQQIQKMQNFYPYLKVDQYVIMPNHIHFMLRIENGPSGRPVPTVQNSMISKFIGTFKRFCNRQYGENIWQFRSYDHVVRNERDYIEICRYIEQNPIKWSEDRFYIP